MKTGFTAWTFSLSGYLLPFMFVLNPAFLMIGSVSEIALAAVTGAVGVMTLGAAVAGHVRMRLKALERSGLLIAAVVLIHPGLLTDLLGLALLMPVIVRHYDPFRIRSASPT